MIWFNSEAGGDHFFKSGKTTRGLATIKSAVMRTAPILLPTIKSQIEWVARLPPTRVSAPTKSIEATAFRQSAWTAFVSMLFIPSEPGAA